MKKTPRTLSFLLLFAIVDLSAVFGVFAASETWRTGGPEGVSILALAGGDKTLFAASNHGVYKSADWGHRWDLVLAADIYVTSLAIDPLNPSVVFAAGYSSTGTPLFKSTDAGQSWRAITKGLELPDNGYDNGIIYALTSLSIDPVDSRVIYAGTWGYEYGFAGGIIKSSDAGESWGSLSGSYGGRCAEDLKVDPRDRRTLYALTGCGAPWASSLIKSTDGGASWAEIENGLPPLPYPQPTRYPPQLLKSILIDLRESSHLYVATTRDGVYRSRDAGATWQPVNEGLPRCGACWFTYPTVEALTQGQDGVLYAGLSPDGLFKSTDGGDHWVPLNFGSRVTGIRAVTARSLLYVIGPRAIYRSADGGASWIQASQGIIGSGIWSLAADPTMPGVLYAGTFMDSAAYDDGNARDGRWTPSDPPAPGAFRSADRGRTWSRTSLPTGGYFSFAVDSRTGTIYATDTYALFKSVDHGETWQDLDVPSHSPRALAIDPERSILYVGTMDNGVLKSADGGGSWSAVNNGLTAGEWRPVFWLAIDPGDTNVIFAATGDRGVFKTTDGGRVWTRLLQGLTYRTFCATCPGHVFDWNFYISRMAIDPSSPQVVYAGTDPVTDPNTGAVLVEGGVYKSVDGGLTWSWAGHGLQSRDSRGILDLAVDPRNHQVYASTYAGIYRSEGEQMSWLPISDQLARSLALDVHPPGALYAGTLAGVFTMTPWPGSNPAVSKGSARE